MLGIDFPFSSLLIGYALRLNKILLHGHFSLISYLSFSPRYVKSPPQRTTSHQVNKSIMTLGQIPLGQPYEKTNLSPFSMPSLQLLDFPSIAVNSNSQSSTIHCCIALYPFKSKFIGLSYELFSFAVLQDATSITRMAVHLSFKSL